MNLWLRRILVATILAGLYYISFRNYLLFHAMAETFSIVIAFALFSMAWNARDIMEDKSLVVLGIAYLFISFLDLFHVLGYKGMGVFPDYDFYANQLWIAARGVEAFTLLIFALFNTNSRIKHFFITWISYSAITVLLLASIFIWKVFPVCFIEGQGQTTFKLISEYGISLILLIALGLFYKKRQRYSIRVSRYLMTSIILTILSEIAFSFYISNYGFSNLAGHYLKIFSFYYLYRAVIIEGLRNPLSLFMQQLNVKKNALEEANGALNRILSIIGHDLRNAVSGFENLAGLLIDGYCDGDTEQTEKILHTMRDNASETEKTLESLLDWTRTQAGSIEAEAEVFSLFPIIEEVIANTRLAFMAKNLSAETDGKDNILIEADQRMFRTVLQNLVDNAVKFSNKGGTIRIQWEIKGPQVILSVGDEGIGLSTEMKEKILKNESVPSRRGTAGEKGTGLGLDIVRTFLSLNTGEMEIDSEPGKGCVFRTFWPSFGNKLV